MINLYDNFLKLNRGIKDSQYPINYQGAIRAYYGVSKEGFYRISFLSSVSSGITKFTKNIGVTSGSKDSTNFWTCFDLMDDSLLNVFCTFGEDLISSIFGENNEQLALNKLKLRYKTWLALFRRSRSPLSKEKAQGLYGELYFLKNKMIPLYGISDSINSWSGPDSYSKDFSIKDSWYEIKTISNGSPIVKISSIQQLSSDYEGKLVVIKVEEMSDAFSSPSDSIYKICQDVLTQIKDNEVKDTFLTKLSEIGYDFCDELGNKKYNVSSVSNYIVNNQFPILRETDIKSQAVNNVSYDLILKLIDAFKEANK